MQSVLILYGYIGLVLLNRTKQKSATVGRGGNNFSNLAVSQRKQKRAIAYI